MQKVSVVTSQKNMLEMLRTKNALTANITLLYQEQCKPRVFHSECVNSKSQTTVILQDVLRGV